MEDQIQINTTLSVKDAIKSEYVRCAKDVVYFIKKYCWIQHPTKGRIPFILFLFQEKMMGLLQQNRYTIINKSRQLGISTLVAAYSLWLTLFHKDKNVLVIATKQETAKNMVTKVRFMYENLPSWLRLPALEDNKLSLKLVNGSQVKAVSAAGDAGRSEAVSLLVIDEAAFIEGIEDIFASAQQTLATGGQCIAISTPNGMGNWFNEEFEKAELGENLFVAVRLPWTVHPERDQHWRNEQDKVLGHKLAAQECDCDFMTSGDTVIDPEVLNWYDTSHVKDPIRKEGVTQDYWIWDYPDYTREYMVVADVARGDDKDYSAFHVIDVVNFEQVAEFKSKVPTREFAKILVASSIQYNQALLVVENNSIGWDVINSIIEMNYPNLYYSPKGQSDLSAESYIGQMDNDNTVAGFTLSAKTRPLIVVKLKEVTTDHSFIFHSKRLSNELRKFIWKGAKAEAMRGSNDDLCIPAGIASYVRDYALRFGHYGQELTRATLNNISRTQLPINSNPLDGGINPWRMNVGPNGQQEDISWLI